MVVCSHCGFKTTLLEYHAWKDVHEAKPPRRKVFFQGEFRKDNETFDIAETYKKLGEVWNSIRIPILIIVFILMLTLIIIVARR
jgi:hypothetical protein